MYQARDLGTKTMTSSNVAVLNETVSSAPLPAGSPSPAPVGIDILVSTKQLEAELPTYEIAATVGDHTEKQSHSIGAGGTNPKQPAAMTTDELQAWLDDKRQMVADNAAWHAAMEAASLQIT